MFSRRNYAVCLLIGAAIAIAGCTAPIVRRTADFSAAAAPALIQTSDAYALAQGAHAGTVLAQRVDNFDAASILKPAPPGTFGTAGDLRVRQQVVGLLAAYVTTLAEASGAEHATPADTNSRDTAATLAKLAADGLPMLAAGEGAAVSPADTSAAGEAIGALSRIVMEQQRRRALPRILRQADPAVQTLCGLLEKDFGAPDTGGLRKVVRTDYSDWLAHEDAAIRDHANGYSYPEKRAAITALYALQAREAADDTALALAKTALGEFARVHHTLATSDSAAAQAVFREQLGELIVASREIVALQQKGSTP